MKDESYEEYMNRKLEESVQYKTHYETVEELTMSKYYDYEVEEEKPKKNKSLQLIKGIVGITLEVLFFDGLFLFIILIIVNLIGG